MTDKMARPAIGMEDEELVAHVLEMDSTLEVNGLHLAGIASALRSDYGLRGTDDREVVVEAHENAHANGEGGAHAH